VPVPRGGFQIVPFLPGRRPTDEARHPALGSSDPAAFLTGDGDENRCYVLITPPGVDGDGYALDATLSFTNPDGSVEPYAGWRRRPVPFTVFEPGPDGTAALRELPLAELGERPLVLALAPDRDLAGGPDGAYGFARQFSQRVAVELRLTRHGAAVATANGGIDVYDVRRFGSLYARLVEALVVPDTARQAQAAGVESLSHAYHPWFPVLLIGSHKAELYTRALVGDIVGKRRNLADPGWLVRVGLYLELLTCLGVAEAVCDEAGDILTPAERAAFESADAFAEIRDRLNPEGWREVWRLRHIAFPRIGVPRTGPVSALNLLNKRRATLEFLHVHHADLQHAIALAGPNAHDAQETWQRVFRDAERAVLRMTPDAFPELGHLPAEVREQVLWHRLGHVGLRRVLRVPGPLPRLLGDQDGLFASACNQYRASMNHVADWARGEGLMDHTGPECVPRQVSLLEAHMNQPSRVALLQRRDGYRSERLEVGAELPEGFEPPLVAVERLLANAPVFAMLEEDEVRALTRAARPLTFGPSERIVVQGQEGDSLFVVAEGEVEVVLRRDDGSEISVDTMRDGAVIGEMSLLTGAPRSATVRAIEGAVVYEIGPRQYEPLLELRPKLADDLAREMHERLRARGELLAGADPDQQRAAIKQRLLRFLGGDRGA
jgi:CRP-like cAMP-binding protein